MLHRAEIRPTKLELLSAWLPGRPWFQGEAEAGVVTDSVELAVVRRVGTEPGPARARLSGTWDGQPAPLPLASAAPR